MEEQRIGMMYLNLLKKSLGGMWDGLFPRGFRRSSALPIVVILLVIVLPIAAWKLHRLGRFGFLKREIAGIPQNDGETGPRPGGLLPIVLKRDQTAQSNSPEFRSITLLPGLGMDVLQITAFVPNKGEVSLLSAPTVQDVADGSTPNRTGVNDRWGAIEAPWSGLLSGSLTPVGSSVRTSWHGKVIQAANDSAGRAYAEGGLLNKLNADASELMPQPNPTSATATFKNADFDQHWPAKNDVTVTATLDAQIVNLTVTVRNISDQPEPMGLGWHPRFVIPSGNRDAVELRLPGGQVLEIPDRAKQIPSGRMEQPGLAIGRFQVHPWPIGPESVDASLVRLKAAAPESKVSAEIRDPQSEIGLRMTAISNNIRELRLSSPEGSGYVGLGMQTNLDDPFGREWPLDDAIQTLLPGQTAEWKISLEIFAIPSHPTPR